MTKIEKKLFVYSKVILIPANLSFPVISTLINIINMFIHNLKYFSEVAFEIFTKFG